MSVEHALTEFIQSLNNLRQAMDREYLEQAKALGCQVKGNLAIHQKYFGIVTLGNIPEWQKRLLNNIWALWSPPSILKARPRRRRPRPSLFPCFVLCEGAAAPSRTPIRGVLGGDSRCSRPRAKRPCS